MKVKNPTLIRQQRLLANKRKPRKKSKVMLGPSPSKEDPTRTAGIRRTFLAELKRRFSKLKVALIKLIVDEDAFGLKDQNHSPYALHPTLNEQSSVITSSQVDTLPDGSFRLKPWVVNEIVENANCGTGAGGFQPGNTCARGVPGGGRTRDAKVTQGIADKLMKLLSAKFKVPPIRIELRKMGGHLGEYRNATGIVGRSGYIPASIRVSEDALVESIGHEFAHYLGDHIWTPEGVPQEPPYHTPTVMRYIDSLNLDQLRLTANTRWMFASDLEKIQAFKVWLQTQIDQQLLNPQDDIWTKYVQAGFQKGAGRAFEDYMSDEAILAEAQQKLDFYAGTKEQFLRSAFAQPVAVDKVQLLAARAFTEMEGVTTAMATQMGRTLTDGLAQGKNPIAISRDLVKDVTGIGENRAETIATTEIIRAHAEGQLVALEQLGAEEVGVAVEWVTSGLGTTKKGYPSPCSKCAPMAGVVLKLEEARGLIPFHPRCKCAWIPANVAESKDKQKRTKPQIDKAVAKAEKDSGLEIDIQIGKNRPRAVVGNVFNPNQPRDAYGRWSELGGGSLSRETHTPEFKRWFGDSKVVDAGGKPKVMYHGTQRDVSSFSPFSHFGTLEAANDRVDTLDFFYSGIGRPDRGEGTNIIPVYLKVENPLRLPDLAGIDNDTFEPFKGRRRKDQYPLGWEGEEAISTMLLKHRIIDIDEFEEHRSNHEALQLLSKKGYDGIVYTNIVEDPGRDSWIVFHPTQIKSALGNKGTFDPKDSTIVNSSTRGEEKSSKHLDIEIDETLWQQCQQLIPTEKPPTLPALIGSIRDHKVYMVDGARVKIEHEIEFVEAGNGWRWKFIPKDQLWLDANLDIYDQPFNLYHESYEVGLMSKGMSYDKAHEKASAAEKTLRTRDAESRHVWTTLNAGDNCGTGKGGFQPGNTCATGKHEKHPVGAAIAHPSHGAETIGGALEGLDWESLHGLSGGLHTAGAMGSKVGSAMAIIKLVGGKAGAKVEHIEHVAKEYVADKVGERVAKLPGWLQTPVVATYAAGKLGLEKAFTTYRKSMDVAVSAAHRSGSTADDIKRLKATLATFDIALVEPVKIGVVAGALAAGAGIGTAAGLGVVGSFIPAATAGYLAYNTATDPLGTYNAAGDVVKRQILESRKASKKAGRRIMGALREKFSGGGTEVLNMSVSDAELIENALRTHGYDDWYIALLHAAMAETGNIRESIDIANASYKNYPTQADSGSWTSIENFDPNQIRDKIGRWTAGGYAAAKRFAERIKTRVLGERTTARDPSLADTRKAGAASTMKHGGETTSQASPEPTEQPQIDSPVKSGPISRHVDKQSLSESLVLQKSPLAVGDNTHKWIVDLADGTKGVFKAEEGEDHGKRPHIKGNYYAREVTASEVAETLGLKDLVPATVVRHVDGKIGSMQRFVDNADSAIITYVRDPYDGKKDLARAAAFDYLIGNTDRHMGNWMMTKDKGGVSGGKLALIDHGLSFPEKTDGFANTRILSGAIMRDLNVPKAVSKWKWDKIEPILRNNKLNDTEIAGVKERLKHLQISPTFEAIMDLGTTPRKWWMSGRGGDTVSHHVVNEWIPLVNADCGTGAGGFKTGNTCARVKRVFGKRNKYVPRHQPEYYGKTTGGISTETHHFITDWQDDPTSVPTNSIIAELSNYIPKDPVVLYRGGTVGPTDRFKSWSYEKEIAEAFADELGERTIRRKIYPNEILVDFTKLPMEYKNLLDKEGMGTALDEVIVGYGSELRRLKKIRGNTYVSITNWQLLENASYFATCPRDEHGWCTVEGGSSTSIKKIVFPKAHHIPDHTEWANSLSSGEERALAEWGDGFFTEMRRRIAKGEDLTWKDEALMEALARAPVFQGATYRGMPTDADNRNTERVKQNIEKIKAEGIGGTYIDSGPHSMSIDSHRGLGFTDAPPAERLTSFFSGEKEPNPEPHKGVLFVIHVKSGRSIRGYGVPDNLEFGTHPMEREVVGLPGTVYKIKNIVDNPLVEDSIGNLRKLKVLVELEEVGPVKNAFCPTGKGGGQKNDCPPHKPLSRRDIDNVSEWREHLWNRGEVTRLAKQSVAGGRLEQYHPGEITVYRGKRSKRSIISRGTSWTKSKKVASEYAEGGKVIEMHLTREMPALDINKLLKGIPSKSERDQEVFIPKKGLEQ